MLEELIISKMAIAKKKKRFFEVEIPLIGKTTFLYAFSKEDLKNKIIKYDLTRILRGKNTVMTLVVDVNGDDVTTFPKEIRVLPYFIKKMMRKGTNYVEDSFSAECGDAVLRVKPFLITRRKVSRAVRKALRKSARKDIIEYFKGNSVEKIIQDILKNQFQKVLSLRLKKIYPLSLCEIRVLKVEKVLEKAEKKIKANEKVEKKSEGEKAEEKNPEEKKEEKKILEKSVKESEKKSEKKIKAKEKVEQLKKE